MKRLIVCCDGTWNRPENKNVTNVEKLARTVETDPAKSGGVQQQVHYVSGVGSHWYWWDRLLGGAFGFGLFANVTASYRFLALNYEPGDEIFVFGFSRGAYTARSVVGMIGRVGLLTRDALIANKLQEAVDRYRARPSDNHNFGSSNDEFKKDHCHAPRITFVGVFDTVGALGVPGALRNRHKFHDVKLGPAVQCARQALAIDERRAKFEPTLWLKPEAGTDDSAGRIRQVWFEGVHSDIGGGYDETGLSDTALLWMTREASGRGLVFNHYLNTYTHSGSSAVRHESMSVAYRLLNLIARVRQLFAPSPNFRGGRRVIDPPNACKIAVASAAITHWQCDPSYDAPNLGWFKAALANNDFGPVTEHVVALPEREKT